MNHAHIYPPECPECKADLTQKGAVEFITWNGAAFAGYFRSKLDAAGALQVVNGMLESGMHSATICYACGHLLAEHEVVHPAGESRPAEDELEGAEGGRLLDHTSEKIGGGGEGIVLRVRPAEHAAILAGLRLLQREFGRETAPDGHSDQMNSIHEILTNCGTLTALTAVQIDDLCERINTKPAVKTCNDHLRKSIVEILLAHGESFLADHGVDQKVCCKAFQQFHAQKDWDTDGDYWEQIDWFMSALKAKAMQTDNEFPAWDAKGILQIIHDHAKPFLLRMLTTAGVSGTGTYMYLGLNGNWIMRSDLAVRFLSIDFAEAAFRDQPGGLGTYDILDKSGKWLVRSLGDVPAPTTEPARQGPPPVRDI